MLVDSIFVIAGLAGLGIAAEWLTKGSALLSQRLGLSPIFIGMTIVAFGTSAPEIFVTVNAAVDGSPGISIGNIVGSNIANIALILGATAIFMPIPVQREDYLREIPLFLLTALALFGVCYDLKIDQIEGLILTAGLIGFLSFAVLGAKDENGDELDEETKAILGESTNMVVTITQIIVGLIGLVVASELLVNGAVGVAEKFGLDEYTIAATVVAFGTSSPELAASLSAARRGHPELAIGNVVGSNIWNILAALGLAGIFSDLAVADMVLTQDIPFLLALSVVTGFFLFQGIKFGRFTGLIFVLLYVGYNIKLYAFGQ